MQLASKMRFTSAQLLALFDDGLGLRSAAHANAMAARLRGALEATPTRSAACPSASRPQANAVFAVLPNDAADRIRERVRFYDWDRAAGRGALDVRVGHHRGRRRRLRHRHPRGARLRSDSGQLGRCHGGEDGAVLRRLADVGLGARRSDRPHTRFPRDVRWTGVLAETLGGDYVVIEEGLSARTTNVDDPTDPRLNGAAHLPITLASHLPLDLVVLMLGTNDTKAYFHRTPFDIATGMSCWRRRCSVPQAELARSIRRRKY